MRDLAFGGLVVCTLLFSNWSTGASQENKIDRAGGTLVVAVPVSNGLVVCSDKRLLNETTGSFRDDFVKLHKVSDKSVFVATHTTGFLNKTTGKMGFDIFDVTQNFVARNAFLPKREYWTALRNEIQAKLSSYLSSQKFQDLPETDVANNRLLFNLIFFSVDESSIRSYSISVFYEKAQRPVINVADVVTETVRTPKLIGKGKDVMMLFARDPSLGRDPTILKFDQSNFSSAKTSVSDAVSFASRLFKLTSSELPQAAVSAAHDCGVLRFVDGFSWIDDEGKPISVR